jgi:hypothetical protein
VGPGFSPLDETLGLLAGVSFSPWLVDSIVRLGARVPFGQVPALIAHFTGTRVSAATVRRLTEAAGQAQVAVETAAVARIEQALPEPPAGPTMQCLSVDGAMVPLVGGTWAEVKTLAIGTVTHAVPTEATMDALATRTVALSYFSRLADHVTFGRLATVETQRRGTERAGTVVAVVDGADWCQGFIDLHRPDAVRILDFAHALEHLGAVAQGVYGAGTAAASEWLGQQAHALRHGHEQQVLERLVALAAASPVPEVVPLISATERYLATRQAQIRYQTFVAAGYPIGSGCVESANKLVVEARLKGSGMHWARPHVNPMLALRTLLCNGRWEEDWPDLWRQWRGQAREQTTQRRQARSPVAPDGLPSLAPPQPVEPPAVPPPPRAKTIVNGKPTAEHPWRHS